MSETEHLETTEAHFEAFKTACFKWRGVLGLDWVELLFVHLDDPAATASASYDGTATWATIRLCKTWDTPRPLTDATLDRLARHEVCHVLAAELHHLATTRYCTEFEVDAADERLVCRIEALMERMGHGRSVDG